MIRSAGPARRVTAARVAAWLACLAAGAGLAVAMWPAAAVAAGAVATAWRRGWRPRRLLVAAAWSAPLVLAWLIATAVASPSWRSVAGAPLDAWLAFWRQLEAGQIARAVAGIAPLAIPIGLLAGALGWSYRIRSLSSGAGGLSPAAGPAFDRRQWRHQVHAARAL